MSLIERTTATGCRRAGASEVPGSSARRRARAGQEEAERGAVGVLALGLCVILLLLSVTVMAVSSVYIEQRKLQLLADQCADAATTRVADFEADGARPGVTLDPGQVASATQEVIGGVGHGVDAVAIAPGTGVVDASTARVELTARAHPPLVGWVVPDGVRIRAESSSRVVLTR
ncbi:hypothetical protein I6H58_10375 [Rothia kristinae]|uniref:Putative Flp pilus-assembly TadG-like N-terminal domain-containing protein n=1 Tax=Rothia kristinae TaxID=37923 RepID=A0A7T4T490_9MICC|nr:pilus assembly protein TadG-related protein [Rothia kristinae]QQC59325.1 hypothetical protein I6H58_10375 [Rothia kristinae]